MTGRFWPGAVVQLVIAADFSCCKPIHLTVAMGANNDLIGILRKIATSVTQNRESSNFNEDAIFSSNVFGQL